MASKPREGVEAADAGRVLVGLDADMAMVLCCLAIVILYQMRSIVMEWAGGCCPAMLGPWQLAALLDKINGVLLFATCWSFRCQDGSPPSLERAI